MALWICQGCGAAYSVDAPACPQCGDTDHSNDYEEREPMAKITVHGGPSNADAEVETPPEPAEAPEPAIDETPEEPAPADDTDTPASKRTRK